MVKRICPVCDQVMTLPHYCMTCRRYVKDPWVRDITYHLNEQHEAHEMNCSYHDTFDTEDKQDGYERMASAIGSAMISRAKKAEEKVKKQYTAAVPNQPRQESRKKKSSGNKVILFIIIVYVLMQLFAVGAMIIGTLFDKVLSSNQEYDIDLGDFLGNQDDTEYLEKADVIAAGQECTSIGHFDIQGKDIQEEVLKIIGDQNLTVERVDEESWNERFQDGSSLYETIICMECVSPKDEDADQMVRINYDTASGRLHEIDIYFKDKEKICSVTEQILNMLDQHEIILEDVDMQELLELMEDGMKNGNSIYEPYSKVNISSYSYDDEYNVYISRE